MGRAEIIYYLERMGKGYETDRFKAYVIPYKTFVLLILESEEEKENQLISFCEFSKDAEMCIKEIKKYWSNISNTLVDRLMDKQRKRNDG